MVRAAGIFSCFSSRQRNTSHESPWLPPGTLKGWPAVASDTFANLVSLFGFLSESREIRTDMKAVELSIYEKAEIKS